MPPLNRRRDKAPRPFWVCPKCGRQFSARNTYHSCGTFSLDHHFGTASPDTRLLFDHLLARLQTFGAVSAHPLKTRIVLQADRPFAAVVPRKRWLDVCLWLNRKAGHPLIRRVEMQVYRDYGHYLRLTQPSDLDDDLLSLLQEAVIIGSRHP